MVIVVLVVLNFLLCLFNFSVFIFCIVNMVFFVGVIGICCSCFFFIVIILIFFFKKEMIIKIIDVLILYNIL